MKTHILRMQIGSDRFRCRPFLQHGPANLSTYHHSAPDSGNEVVFWARPLTPPPPPRGGLRWYFGAFPLPLPEGVWLLCDREYWMIYRWPGSFALVWCYSSPTPSPLSLSRLATHRKTEKEGEGGLGEEPNHTTARKPGHLSNHSIPSGVWALGHNHEHFWHQELNTNLHNWTFSPQEEIMPIICVSFQSVIFPRTVTIVLYQKVRLCVLCVLTLHRWISLFVFQL